MIRLFRLGIVFFNDVYRFQILKLKFNTENRPSFFKRIYTLEGRVVKIKSKIPKLSEFRRQ